MQADRLPTEEARLAALHDYDILDSPIELEFEDITKLVSKLCNTPIAVINLIDRNRQWFLSEVGLGVRETPLDISICAHALLQQGLFIVKDTLQDPRFADNPLVAGEPHLRYYAGSLLETSDGYPIGTLCVLDYQPRELSDDQLDAIQILSRQVMKQLELRRLIKSQKVAIEERDIARSDLAIEHAREKRIAETLQRSLLMDERECSFSGIDIVPRYEAAWKESIVGGDFYDVFALDADHIVMVVGDVAGKGLDAAARTAEVKFALRAFFQEHMSPARAFDRLNNFLCSFHNYQKESVPRFVAAIAAVVNIESGAAQFAHAGVDPAIVLHADGSSSLLAVGEIPLGIEPDITYRNESRRLSASDIIVIATDGITEARKDGEFLGTQGLVTIICEERQGSLPAWADAVLSKVKRFSGGILHDDVCMIMAKLTRN